MRIDDKVEPFTGSDKLKSALWTATTFHTLLTPEMISAMPKTFRMVSNRKEPLEHFVAGSFGHAISQTFKDIIDRLEPESDPQNPKKNQYIPITLLKKNREPTGVPFYYWRCINKIDAIIVEKSDVEWQTRKIQDNLTVTELSYTKQFADYCPNPEIYLDKERIAGQHIWWGKDHLRSQLFFSDEMKQAADAAGFQRFDFFPAHEL